MATDLKRSAHDGEEMETQELGALVQELHKLTVTLEEQVQDERPMTRDQAAAYLKVHPDTLYKWARENRVTYSRLGNGSKAPMRFMRRDLDEFMSRERIPALD